MFVEAKINLSKYFAVRHLFALSTHKHTLTHKKYNEFLELFPSKNVGQKAPVVPRASVVEDV